MELPSASGTSDRHLVRGWFQSKIEKRWNNDVWNETRVVYREIPYFDAGKIPMASELSAMNDGRNDYDLGKSTREVGQPKDRRRIAAASDIVQER
jgi:hypothetical protein